MIPENEEDLVRVFVQLPEVLMVKSFILSFLYFLIACLHLLLYCLIIRLMALIIRLIMISFLSVASTITEREYIVAQL